MDRESSNQAQFLLGYSAQQTQSHAKSGLDSLIQVGSRIKMDRYDVKDIIRAIRKVYSAMSPA